MARNSNTDQRGNYCGRAVHAVSSLTSEDWRQIEAHRYRDRPTPWQALSDMYRVPVSDLKTHFEACQIQPPAEIPEKAEPTPSSASPWDERATRLLRTMWCELHLTSREIADALRMTEDAVNRKARRMGLSRTPLAVAA